MKPIKRMQILVLLLSLTPFFPSSAHSQSTSLNVAVLYAAIQFGGLRGFVDLHTHPMSNIAFGGKLIYGGADVGSLLPADPDCHHNVRATSMEQALGHDKSTHGGWDALSNQCGDDIREKVIHGIQAANGAADESSDAKGAPDFSEWPVWNDITHQKMWVDWIRRAYDAGLRVLVALAVNNRTLGDATAGPGDFATDDKSSGDLQIAELKDFVARHSDFMEVAYSSADLARIISSNKLSIVLGIELDNIGNLLRRPPSPLVPNPTVPTQAEISAEINRLYDEGVRYIFLIHVIDNAFGGTATYIDLFNYSNVFEAGWFWGLQCADPTDNIVYKFKPQSLELAAVEFVKLGSTPIAPSYPDCYQRNKRGLTSEGEFALKEIMRLGMMIDIDHMSQNSANRALEVAEAVPNGGYPLNSGHNGIRGFEDMNSTKTERSLTSTQYARIGRLHGMAGVGSAGYDSYTWIDAYNAVINAMGNNAVAGFGTDTNGLALGMPTSTEQRVTKQNPRYAECVAREERDCTSDLSPSQLAACRANAAGDCGRQFPPVIATCSANCGHPAVQYGPFFVMSSLGTRSWDYNAVGVAHYGMIADFLQAVRSAPGGANLVDVSLMHGAEYFFQMWKQCETQKTNIPQ